MRGGGWNIGLPCPEGMTWVGMSAERLQSDFGKRMFSNAMPNRVLKNEFLGPEDLALCQRVFVQMCADARLDRLSLDAELLAAAILSTFQRMPVGEAELLEAIRSRRADFAG